MKSTSLSINLACPCPNRCPFCISRLTQQQGSKSSANARLVSSIPKAIDYCRFNGIDTVLVTGRGEPMMVDRIVVQTVKDLKAGGIPRVELQTSGAGLTDELIGVLAWSGLSTISISAASVDEALNQRIMNHDVFYGDLIHKISEAGMIPRLSLNLTRKDWLPWTHAVKDCRTKGGPMADEPAEVLVDLVDVLIDRLRRCGCKQLTLRSLGKPRVNSESSVAGVTAAWIDEHGADLSIPGAITEHVLKKRGYPVYRLDYGPVVWSYGDMSVVTVDCMATTMEDAGEIRSTVLQADGLVHVGWQNCPIC